MGNYFTRLLLLLTFISCAVFGARVLDIDQIRSSDRVRLWDMPVSSGTLPTLTSVGTFTNKLISGSDNTLTNIPSSALSTMSSGSLAGIITNETGTGSLVFSTSPTISGATLSNAVLNSPAITGGTITSGAFNSGTITSSTLVTSSLGTPTSGVATNLTGTAAGLTAGNVTTNANLTGAITSVGNAALLGTFSSGSLSGALSDETGSGVAVFATSATLVTPVLGAATGTSLGLGGALDASALLAATSTTKGFLGPRVTQAQRDAISSPAAGLQIYNSDSGKLNIYNGTIWKEVGSGTSGVNYITDTDGSAIGSWVTYADAAASSPVDGTGGSPSSTYAVSTGTTLRGANNFLWTHSAANRQGEGFSYAFTIDPADKYSVLQASFDYLVSSGTYADDDMQFWIYDVTNAVLIQPAPFKLKNATIAQKFAIEFQATSSTSYRLIGHVATATATAYTLRFDNWNLGPQAKLYGSPITDWVSYTTTVAGLGTGSSTNFAYWRRVGDTLQYDITISKDGSGGSGGTAITATIPSGLIIDAAKVPNSVNVNHAHGVASYHDNSVRNAGASVAATTTQIAVTIANSLTSNIFTGADFAANGQITMKGSVPIVGWSSSVIMSSDAATNVVNFIGTNSSTQSVTASVTNIAVTTVKDSNGGWAANIFTVPTSGDYQVGIVSADTVASTAFRVYKTGAASNFIGGATANNYGGGFTTITCVAGDTIAVRSTVTGTLVANTNITISRISGPAQIASGTIIAAIATGDPASATVGNPIIVPTSVYDSTGSYSVSTGRFTCPIQGIYKMYGSLASASAATTLTIYKDAVSTILAGNLDSNGEATFSASVNCLSGQLIDIRPGGTVDATSMSLNIEKLGGVY